MPPRVSVVLPAYNSERYLAAAIASVLSQTFADFELIVVDDASSDGTPGIIAEYARRDDRLQPVYLEENQGTAAARNHGLGAARGELIAVMDGDDICLPDRFRKQVTYLDANADVGALGGNVFFVDDDLSFRHQASLPQEHALIVWGLFFGQFFCHPTCMIRRKLLDEAGGYAAGLLTADDLELWTRLAGKTRFANLPDICLLYRRHPHAEGIGRRASQDATAESMRQRLLQRLWGEAPAASLHRFQRLHRQETDFRRADRQALRADLSRLIHAQITAGWVTDDDRPLLIAAMERIMRQVTPGRRRFWKRLT